MGWAARVKIRSGNPKTGRLGYWYSKYRHQVWETQYKWDAAKKTMVPSGTSLVNRKKRIRGKAARDNAIADRRFIRTGHRMSRARYRRSVRSLVAGLSAISAAFRRMDEATRRVADGFANLKTILATAPPPHAQYRSRTIIQGESQTS
jgi:hypothetical protein